ncbi:CD180 antigen [Ochotona curzoniae]|uniref:CD180 antigen n=1 Tax=Ochotona curzoniae TaxID=130825 RepID=UPI001B34ED8B|nr:CD180 antigen [Ochotona curzoniae]
MAPDVGCFLLALLIPAICKLISSSDQVCIEKEVNKTYNCDNLGLSRIPDTLSNKTEILEFSFNFLPAIQNTTFNRLPNLTFLDITRCQINWIHEDAFQSQIQLRTLVLTGNPLVFIAETAFNGPVSLKHLFLIQTGITSLEFIPGHNLKNLESLYLGSNHISSIKLPENFPTKNLKVLDFENNAIHFLHKEDMKPLKQASNLSLNFNCNDIKSVEPEAFTSMTFQRVNFGGTVDLSGIFNGLRKSTIQSLWLGSYEDTDDAELNSTTFQGLCEMSVKSINLQKHHFHDPTAATFQCFTQLLELDLTATHLHQLPSAIKGMQSLKKLVLSVNKFEDLCHISAASFPSLTHLYIKGNTKKLQLGVECLKTLGNLEHLDLSHNDLEAADCCQVQFRGLLHLENLNLSYNEPLQLQSQAFKDCPKLRFLDLAFTHLKLREQQSPFQKLYHLQVLNLSHCLLDTRNQNLLVELPDLRHLNLQGNLFYDGTIPQTNLLQTLSRLESLVLASCGLHSIDPQAFRSLGDLSVVDLSYNNLTHDSLEALGHLKGIYLNLATNVIRTIPYHLITILSQQTTINLSHNPLDCTCSNNAFLTWYQANLQKLEGSEETVCATPPSLRGVKLSAVKLHCGLTVMGICFLVVLLGLFVILLIFAIKFLLRWKYQHI